MLRGLDGLYSHDCYGVVMVVLVYYLTGGWLMSVHVDLVFEAVERCQDDPVIVDFSMVRGVSHSFARGYADRVRALGRRVVEVNMPPRVARVISVFRGV